MKPSIHSGLLVLAALVGFVSSASVASPLILWSSDASTQETRQHVGELDARSLAHYTRSMASKPHIILFLASQISETTLYGDLEHAHGITNLLKTQASLVALQSTVLSGVRSTSDAATLIAESLGIHAADVAVVGVHDRTDRAPSSHTTLSQRELTSWFSSRTNRPSVVVVELDHGVASADATVASVVSSVPGSYIALLTGTSGSSPVVRRPRKLATATESVEYVYITPGIVTGLALVAVLGWVLYVGLSCLDAIQTPSRWHLHALKPGKEY